MSGQTDLATLLASLQPELQEGVFVFVSQGPDSPALPDDVVPIMRFREQEGWTSIVKETAAFRAGLDGSFRCRLVTLKVHSSLEAVGLLAAVTTRLAAAGISVNAVSAFYHDHFFVAPEHAEKACAILRELRVGAIT
jgi:hypothetical protein